MISVKDEFLRRQLMRPLLPSLNDGIALLIINGVMDYLFFVSFYFLEHNVIDFPIG